VRVDPGTQLAERGVGVDGHHRVNVADLREARPCAGRDGGFAIRVGGVVVIDHNPVRR
jgi:hypothetical protein